jgi:shikimate dehydrogenase
LDPTGFAGGKRDIPHKEAALRLVAEATPRARRLGSVNTLWREAIGCLLTRPTGEGFLASLADTVGPGWAESIGLALVLGAGGAARAIVGALLDEGLRGIVIANRTEARAHELARLAPDRIGVMPWQGLGDALPRTDLLVNTTQCGMEGQPPLDIDTARLPGRAIVADIVYVPLETELLKMRAPAASRSWTGLECSCTRPSRDLSDGSA